MDRPRRPPPRHRPSALGEQTRETGRTVVHGGDDVACADPDCPIRSAVTAPLVMDDLVVGTLTAWTTDPSPGLARATEEVAAWVSSQLALAELARTRTRVMEAELRALRAQISPHFIYNSLAAIASFVRTDPDRARELLIDFADFTRYALRTGGPFTTLAEELRNVERYLVLEQARFGDRLQISLLIAPEVLPVTRALPRGPAARRERRAPRPGDEGGRRAPHDHRERPRLRRRDLHRGRRGRHRPRAGAAASSTARTPPTRSASATSTPGCARSTATSSGSSSRPLWGRARR